MDPMEPRRRLYLAPQFSLRTLLVLMLLAGPLGGWGWTRWQAWRETQIQEEARQLREKQYAAQVAQLRAIYSRNMQALLNAQAASGGGGTKNLSGEEYERMQKLTEEAYRRHSQLPEQTESANP